MELRAHRLAIRELRDAVTLDESERPGRGLDLAFEVDRVFQRLQALPRSAPCWSAPIGEYEVRRATVMRHPYVVVYSIHTDHVLVLAIAHTSRRPGYWVNRLNG